MIIGNSTGLPVVFQVPWPVPSQTVPSDLAPKWAKTTMAGVSWMWRNYYIW
jgi:hypothetical protein